MDEPGGLHAKRYKLDTERQILHDLIISLYVESLKKKKKPNSKKQRVEWWFTRSWKEGVMGSYFFNGYRVSILQDEKNYGDRYW